MLSAGLGVFANVAAPSALLTERQGRFVMEATTDEWPLAALVPNAEVRGPEAVLSRPVEPGTEG